MAVDDQRPYEVGVLSVRIFVAPQNQLIDYFEKNPKNPKKILKTDQSEKIQKNPKKPKNLKIWEFLKSFGSEQPLAYI